MQLKNTAIAIASCAQLVTAFIVPQNVLQKTMSVSDSRRLIELAPYVQRWMTEEEINELIAKDSPFMDITDYQERKALRDERRQKKSRTPKKPANVTNGDIYDMLLVINKNLESLLSSR